MPAERRLLAMRRRVLPGALGAWGQRAERLMRWKKAERSIAARTALSSSASPRLAIAREIQSVCAIAAGSARVRFVLHVRLTGALIARGLIPASSRSAPSILIWLSLLLLSLTAICASAAGAAPITQSQTQPQAPASGGPNSVLELPREGSPQSLDRELSRKITENLDSHRLGSVTVQVFADKKGNRTVVLSGQVASEPIKDQAERQVRDLLRDSALAIQNRIGVGREPGSTPPPIAAGQNELELPQVGRLSRQFLGCWRGTTAERPLGWQALSPTASYLGYHSDLIRLCLTLKNGELRVTDASSQYANAKDAYGKGTDYGFTYKPERASGTQILLDLRSWDPTMPGYTVKGSARCTLNADDTVTYFLSVTTSINGQAAVRTETVARLERDR